MYPTYKVRVLKVDKSTLYHIVNIKTNVTHSVSYDYMSAMTVMRDLNRMVNAKKAA